MDLQRSVWFGGALAGFASLACWVAAAQQGPPSDLSQTRQVRRPVAAAFLGDGQTVGVVNHRSGTVSLVDVRQARVLREVAVGQRLTGLAVLPDRKHVLVVDESRHELIALSLDGSALQIRARLAVGPYPASVAVLSNGTLASVASRWSHRLDVVDLAPLTATAGPVALRTLHTLRLPFAPRDQCVLPGQARVAVADAFGSHLAVVDGNAGKLIAVHELAGHNLRGLAVSADGERLLVAHQVLDPQAAATRENIQRGVLMANVLRSIPMDRLLTPRANLEAASPTLPLGRVGAGAGDPAGVAVLDRQQLAVALAGVNEVALVREEGKEVRRLPVGRRPTAVLAGGPRQPAVVLNTHDDSLSILDPRRDVLTHTIVLGPSPPLESWDRGALLFHDARLARDGWMSCHSCHTDGHTNGRLADTLGDHTFGTPKRTLTLMNTALTDPWGWNGGFKYLHDQVQKSLEDTMDAPAVPGEQVNDLVTFLHTLPPPPPLEPVTAEESDRAQVERGRRIFLGRGCSHCHIPPLTYSSHDAHDVGFADERGQKKFNPPSLRGVSQGYRFLHDNRAATLEEVFTRFRHKVGADMPPDQLADLLRFLRSL